MDLVVAEGGGRGQVLQWLGGEEGGVENRTRGREVAGREEVGGEAVGWGLEGGDGAVAEGPHVRDGVQDCGCLGGGAA